MWSGRYKLSFGAARKKIREILSKVFLEKMGKNKKYYIFFIYLKIINFKNSVKKGKNWYKKAKKK